MIIAYSNKILKPPDIVFPWIADPEKAKKWQKNVKSGEIIIKKPEIIGTKFREVIEENGNSLEMYGIITEYKKDKIIGFHLKSKIHEFDVRYSLENKNEETIISIEAIIKWNFPMNIINLVIGKKMEENLRKQLESEIIDLKRMCELE